MYTHTMKGKGIESRLCSVQANSHLSVPVTVGGLKCGAVCLCVFTWKCLCVCVWDGVRGG